MSVDKNSSNGRFGAEVFGPGRTYFDDVVVDNLMEAFLELSAQAWITRDRLHVLEKVLEEKGIEAQRLIEDYKPDSEYAESRRAERQEFVDQIFQSFLRRPRQEDGRGLSTRPGMKGSDDG